MRSGTGECLVQALQYKVVLGITLCKTCSIKQYCEVLCGRFVVQSSTASCSRCVKQECPTRVAYKSVSEYWERVFYQSVPQECGARLSGKSVSQERPIKVFHKSAPQEYATRVSQKGVPHDCLRRVSSKSILQEWLLMRSSISCSLFIVLQEPFFYVSFQKCIRVRGSYEVLFRC